MTTQSSVFIMAPLRKGSEEALKSLLASMNTSANTAPGQADPSNHLVPFGEFGQIHYARFVILDDPTLEDIQIAYNLPRVDYPVCLAFIADFDGSADDFRAELARRANAGLQQIFSCCEGYAPGIDLAQWMKDRETPAATMYVNWVGRTVQQIREESALRQALMMYLRDNAGAFATMNPLQVHSELRKFVSREEYCGRLKLTRPARTPMGWWVRNLIHLIGVPVVLLLATPLLILYVPLFLILLRYHEKRDMVIASRLSQERETALSRLEDYDVTNQFTVMGTMKPGLFRFTTFVFLLWFMNWTTRHIFTRGGLARISTIHFARWVFINGKRRVVFASNYDGSLESYMDDFINKVGFGLNLSFSVGIGYPVTRWLVLDGSKDEQNFKYVLRRHELPTETWYKAYPGLTASDLKRNTLIREGLERSSPSGEQLREWVALL